MFRTAHLLDPVGAEPRRARQAIKRDRKSETLRERFQSWLFFEKSAQGAHDVKSLKQQIPLLSLGGLRDFGAQQSKRLDAILLSLRRGQSDIDKIKADITPFLTGEVRRIGTVMARVNNPADQALQAQAVQKQYDVRKQINIEIRPTFQKMLAAKALATEYRTRHWSKIQVLNRATTGSGATDSLLRRAAYSEIFEQAGVAQLSDFGQLAVDTGDPILADSVYRAVAALPNDKRPFAPAAFLELVPNSDYTEAQQILQAVMDAADSAKQSLDTFDGGRHGQVTQNQIEKGLRAQSSAEAFNIDDLLDASGGVREDALLRMSQRLSDQ